MTSTTRTKPAARFRTVTEDGYRFFEIACSKSATTAAIPLELPILHAGPLVEGLAYRHEGQCGRCSTDRVRAQHGDAQLRAQFEALWSEISRKRSVTMPGCVPINRRTHG